MGIKNERVLITALAQVLDIRNSGDQSWDIPWCSSLTDMGLMRNVKSLRLCFDKHMEPRRIFQLMFAGHRGVGVLEDLHTSVALDREFISTDDDIFLHYANLAEYCYPQRLPPTLKNLSIGVFLKTGEGMPLAHTAEHVDALHTGIVRFLGGSFQTLLSLTVFSTLSLEQFCCILRRLDNGKPFVVHSVRDMEYPWPMTMEDLVESDLYEGSMIQRNGFRVEWQNN